MTQPYCLPVVASSSIEFSSYQFPLLICCINTILLLNNRSNDTNQSPLSSRSISTSSLNTIVINNVFIDYLALITREIQSSTLSCTLSSITIPQPPKSIEIDVYLASKFVLFALLETIQVLVAIPFPILSCLQSEFVQFNSKHHQDHSSDHPSPPSASTQHQLQQQYHQYQQQQQEEEQQQIHSVQYSKQNLETSSIQQLICSCSNFINTICQGLLQNVTCSNSTIERAITLVALAPDGWKHEQLRICTGGKIQSQYLVASCSFIEHSTTATCLLTFLSSFLFEQLSRQWILSNLLVEFLSPNLTAIEISTTTTTTASSSSCSSSTNTISSSSSSPITVVPLSISLFEIWKLFTQLITFEPNSITIPSSSALSSSSTSMMNLQEDYQTSYLFDSSLPLHRSTTSTTTTTTTNNCNYSVSQEASTSTSLSKTSTNLLSTPLISPSVSTSSLLLTSSDQGFLLKLLDSSKIISSSTTNFNILDHHTNNNDDDNLDLNCDHSVPFVTSLNSSTSSTSSQQFIEPQSTAAAATTTTTATDLPLSSSWDLRSVLGGSEYSTSSLRISTNTWNELFVSSASLSSPTSYEENTSNNNISSLYDPTSSSSSSPSMTVPFSPYTCQNEFSLADDLIDQIHNGEPSILSLINNHHYSSPPLPLHNHHHHHQQQQHQEVGTVTATTATTAGAIIPSTLLGKKRPLSIAFQNSPSIIDYSILSNDLLSTPLNKRRRKQQQQQQQQQTPKSNGVTTTTTSLLVNDKQLLSPSKPPPPSSSSSSSSSSVVINGFQAQSQQKPLSLILLQQPSSTTVYRRFLRPSPKLALGGIPAIQDDGLLWVEVSLASRDTPTPFSGKCMGGVCMEKISSDRPVIFDKLKILFTTRQKDSVFRLRFDLKRHTDQGFELIDSAVVFSQPITVYSHTDYVKRVGIPPPIVSTVLPERISINRPTRLCILGKDFVNSSFITVRIGPIEITPKYHTDRTLMVTIPEGSIIHNHALSLNCSTANSETQNNSHEDNDEDDSDNDIDSFSLHQKSLAQLSFPVLVSNDGVSFSSIESACYIQLDSSPI